MQVREVAAAFPSDGRAEFRLQLDVPSPAHRPGKLSGISWELWLNNHWFASGIGALAEEIPPAGRVVEVRFPVAFAHQPTSSTPTPLKVSVRGSLTARFGLFEEQLAFSGTVVTQAKGAPVIGNGIDD